MTLTEPLEVLETAGSPCSSMRWPSNQAIRINNGSLVVPQVCGEEGVWRVTNDDRESSVSLHRINFLRLMGECGQCQRKLCS